MLDNLDPRERRTEQPGPTSRETSDARPLADREVPLDGRATPASIHAWLDGELPVNAVRHGDAARDVDFWLRIEREVEVRRKMKTPVHVYRQIMEALPQAVPQAVPWWRRPFTVTPLLAFAAAVGALALGVVIGAAMLRAR
jgi:hypothetical protein